MKLAITPVPKPRMTRSDRWQQRPVVMRYRAYGDELRLLLGHYQLPASVSLVFYLPMPNSWSSSKKERMANTPHQQRPDIDNLIKAVFDHLATEDSYIWQVGAVKLWAYTGSLEINAKGDI